MSLTDCNQYCLPNRNAQQYAAGIGIWFVPGHLCPPANQRVGHYNGQASGACFASGRRQPCGLPARLREPWRSRFASRGACMLRLWPSLCLPSQAAEPFALRKLSAWSPCLSPGRRCRPGSLPASRLRRLALAPRSPAASLGLSPRSAAVSAGILFVIPAKS